MLRSTTRGVIVVAAIAAVTLSACANKSTDTGSTAGSGSSSSGSSASSAALSIKPEALINPDGSAATATGGGKTVNPAGDGSAKCSSVSIAMAGALTGANGALGANIIGGVKLALDEHNKANAGCQVALKQFDTEGDPQKATQVAPQIVSDTSVLGLVGPAFSGETKATGGIFDQAGLPFLTPSATNPGLSTNGWKTFFRGLANDTSQGAADANYMKKTLSYKKVCVVQDDSDYGVGLAKVITQTLGDAADSSCAADVKTGAKDFSATVSQISAASPDAIFYAGYYAEAAPFVQQLRDGGVKATFVSGDGTNDPEFVKQAGQSAKGSLLSCPCIPAPADFAAKFKTLNSAAAGVYSVEGYDLATILLKAIDGGAASRADVLKFVQGYSGQGIGKLYKWNDKGELSSAQVEISKVG